MTLAQLMAIMPFAGQRASGLGLVREEGARRAAQAKQALAGAREGRTDSEQAATRILALQPEGEACRAAEALIAREMP